MSDRVTDVAELSRCRVCPGPVAVVACRWHAVGGGGRTDPPWM